MQIRKKLDFSVFTLHLLLGVSVFFLSQIGENNEPYSLSLIFAVITADLSPLFGAAFHLLSAALTKSPALFLLSLVQSVLLIGSAFLRKRTSNSILKRLFPMLALSLSLGGFIAFAPFTPYALSISLPLGGVGQKVVLSAAIFLLSACFSVGLKAVTQKLLRCRLHSDEIVFSLLLCVFIGVGVCNFLSVNAYLGVAFFILLVFTYVIRDGSALLCAFTLSLPPFFTSGLPVSYLLLFSVVILFLSKSGRLAMSLGLLAVFFSYGYFNGLYALPTSLFTQSVIAATLPCLLFILTPAPVFKEFENRIIFYKEPHLSRIAINRNRALVAEKLFEISAVFREIESTFLSLGANDAQESAKEYVRGCVAEEVCKPCPCYKKCLNAHLPQRLDKLIAIGCMKDKLFETDFPKDFSEECINRDGLLLTLNRLLVEYRKYVMDTENAENGRILLANQAQGVSEILKNLALEESEPLRIYTDKERALSAALAATGILCTEVLISGEEENLTLSLITYGKMDVKKIAAVASFQLSADMIISERIALSKDKYCCILRKKAYFDAAFGVSNIKKHGESASGDTHSVIRIDERRFMVALSDGMGSGEYARRVSESTISLLESFYRAKMPSDLILSTVNKLLTFNKEETFACVDIAIIDLNDGATDIVKIGSPMGFILTSNTVKVLEGSCLPLGILDSLRPDTATYSLAENDVLLFLSDGVTDAFGSTADLYEFLKVLPLRNPQEIADSIIRRALDSYGGVAKDDMTALAVRLFHRVDTSI